MTVVASTPRFLWRAVLLTVVAAPFFAIGYVAASTAAAGRWCKTATILGLEAARERWKRAG